MKNKKNILIGGLIAVVLLLAVGYAAFATNLNIQGTSKIDSKWDVHIKDNGVTVNTANLATSKKTTKISDLTAEFECDLTEPGKSTISYDVIVENSGTFGAQLTGITVTGATTYIGVSTSKSHLKANDVIVAGGEDTVTVTVSYNDVETPPTLDNDRTASITVTLNFVQAQGSGGGGAVSTTAADYITALAATDSTLIDDGTSDHNIRYSGKNVNNYVCMDSTESTCSATNLYRIIGVFNNIKTTEQGTGESRVKLIKATSLGNTYWNSSTYTNNWTEAYLKTYLQGLSIASNSLVDNAVWNLGGRANSAATPSQFYIDERGNLTGNNMYPTTWTGKVALMYPSDYGYASSVCYSTKNLGGGSPDYRDSDCTESNWLFGNQSGGTQTNEWLLSPSSSYSDVAFDLLLTGFVDLYGVGTDMRAYRPVVFLKSDVELVVDGKDGSSSSPYLLQ